MSAQDERFDFGVRGSALWAEFKSGSIAFGVELRGRTLDPEEWLLQLERRWATANLAQAIVDAVAAMFGRAR